MLHFIYESRIVPYIPIHQKWLAYRPTLIDAFSFVQHFHCKSNGRHFGLSRQVKHTLLINLEQDDSVLLSSFSEKTRYEIRRASKESLSHEIRIDIAAFVSFYNAAALQKGRSSIAASDLELFSQNLLVTATLREGKAMAMHAYLCDEESKIVVLYQSATAHRGASDPSSRSLIGRANRWLHWQDMLLFKSTGYSCYDFGGWSKDATDPELQGINKFKQGFGGLLVEISNYVSFPIIAWNRMRGRSVRK